MAPAPGHSLRPVAIRACHAGAPKIGQLDRLLARLLVGLDQDIRALDVPVDDTARVQELRGEQELPHDGPDLGRVELLRGVKEVAAIRVLEHEVQVEAVGDELALDLAGGREEALGQRMRDRRTDGWNENRKNDDDVVGGSPSSTFRSGRAS